MRGLIKEIEDITALTPAYQVTMEYVRHLGLDSITELPNYQELHRHEYIVNTLETT
jgi:chromosome segregation and condensation protein ScpB